MRMPRLEFQAPPDVFYNESDACKYTTSSRIIGIQDFGEEAAAARPPQQCVPKLLLDIGHLLLFSLMISGLGQNIG